MKINLTLTESRLAAIAGMFQMMAIDTSTTREARAMRNVVTLLSVRFLKKNIEVTAGRTLFTKKKKPKFSLEYFEAHFLEKYVQLFLDRNQTIDMRSRNALMIIRNDLNQSLA